MQIDGDELRRQLKVAAIVKTSGTKGSYNASLVARIAQMPFTPHNIESYY